MEVMTEENKVLQFVADLNQPTDDSAVRKQAKDALYGMDFPTTREEDWKYTRVAKYVKRSYHQATENGTVDEYLIKELGAHQLVFINGFFDKENSIILEDEALSIEKIDQLDEEYYTDLLEDTDENVFSLINKAYQTGGVYIRVKKNQVAQHPIHIIHLIKGEEVIANARHFVHLEEGAQAEMVVSFHSENADKSFTNCVLEGHLSANSNLTLHQIQSEEKTVLNINSQLFIQDKDSNFKSNVITTGGALTRNGLTVLVEGENCHTDLNGAYLGKEKQLIDNHTAIDQLAAHCTSNQLYKGVMDDKSTGVFNGKVIVRPDSQRIEAYQSNKNILLSKDASANSKPELEIYADDVRCSHGSTLGDLDEDALFYMQARGIPKEKARKLLIAAFIGDVLDKIDNDAVRKSIDAHLYEDFGWEF